MDERRSSHRNRVFKGGYLIFNSGRSSISCVVRNLSNIGAKLSVADIVGIPNEFELFVPGSHRRACRVVWHTAHDLGVIFLDQVESGDETELQAS